MEIEIPHCFRNYEANLLVCHRLAHTARVAEGEGGKSLSHGGSHFRLLLLSVIPSSGSNQRSGWKLKVPVK